MGQSYSLFVFKWHLFEKYLEIYHLTKRTAARRRDVRARPWLDPIELKLAIRAPESRLLASRLEANDVVNLNTQFSALLKSGPRRNHIDWLCATIAEAAPALALNVDDWADNTGPYVFAGKLHRIAEANGWQDGLVNAAASLASALQAVVTGEGRLLRNDHTAADLGAGLVPAGRGFQFAVAASEPRRYRIGDQVTLQLRPPGSFRGKFDVLAWQTWLRPPDSSGHWPWHDGDDDNPLLRPLPPLRGQPLAQTMTLFTAPITSGTGPGWHYIGVVGVQSDSNLAARLRAIIDDYQMRAGLAVGRTYDMLAHMRIIRELYFEVGKKSICDGMLPIRDDVFRKDVFFGNCSFELVA